MADVNSTVITHYSNPAVDWRVPGYMWCIACAYVKFMPRSGLYLHLSKIGKVGVQPDYSVCASVHLYWSIPSTAACVHLNFVSHLYPKEGLADDVAHSFGAENSQWWAKGKPGVFVIHSSLVISSEGFVPTRLTGRYSRNWLARTEVSEQPKHGNAHSASTLCSEPILQYQNDFKTAVSIGCKTRMCPWWCTSNTIYK